VKRDLARLERTHHDLLVIGAGIYGACVARDAAQRGLSVALIERGDFGCATSHNSLKLIHGGLRYLQHLDLARVRQSAREQRIWLEIAPHLVRPLEFVLPTYGHGPRGPEALGAAIRLYDFLCRKERRALPPERALPRGHIIGSDACCDRIPGVPAAGLTGGAIWYDAQMINADRLLMACLQDAVANGAAIANYVTAEVLLGSETRIEGVRARCRLSGETLPIRARVTVNACGPWAGQLLRTASGAPGRDLGRLNSNMNLVTTRPVFAGHAAAVSSRRRADALVPRGGRMYFITPWQGRAVIGTSHLPFAGEPEDYDFTEAEIAAFIDEINQAYPPAELSRGDVLYCYAGLTPAAAEPRGSEVRRSRRGQIIDHARLDGRQGLVTLQGVKYTTARLVAEAAVDLAFAKLGRRAPPCRSATTPLPGGEGFLAYETASPPGAPDRAEFHRLLAAYGSDHRCVLEANGGGAGPDDAEAIFQCRVRHAVRYEMTWRLDDLVRRRLEHAALGLLSEARLLHAAGAMAKAHGWSAARRDAEIADVRRILCRHRGVPPTTPATFAGTSPPQLAPERSETMSPGIPLPVRPKK